MFEYLGCTEKFKSIWLCITQLTPGLVSDLGDHGELDICRGRWMLWILCLVLHNMCMWCGDRGQ